MNCTAWGVCGVTAAITSVVLHALPFLQVIAIVLSIAATIKSLRGPKQGK